MCDFKIFTFHSAWDGWRLEIYDVNNGLIKVCKAKDGNDVRTLVEAYRARFSGSGDGSDGVSPPSTNEHV